MEESGGGNPDSTATIRDYLAGERTVLANERTLLAYVRTALSFVVAGAFFVKFAETTIPQAIGWLCIPVGVILFLEGTRRYRRMKARIADVASRQP